MVLSKGALTFIFVFVAATAVSVLVGVMYGKSTILPNPEPCTSHDEDLDTANATVMTSILSVRTRLDVTKTIVDPVETTQTIDANASVGVKAALSTTFIFYRQGIVSQVRVLDTAGALINSTSDAYIEYPITFPDGFCINKTTSQPLSGNVLIGGLLSGSVTPARVLYVPTPSKVIRFLLPTLPDNPLATSPVYKLTGTNNTLTAGNANRNITVLDSGFMFKNDCFKMSV